MAQYVHTATNVSALFKIKYDDLSEATMNTMYPLLSQLKIQNDIEGSELRKVVPLSFGGSVGSGTLPTANTAIWKHLSITTKKVYARLMVDRRTIYLAKSDEGAFVRGTKEYVRKAVESYTRNLARILYGNADGSLGTIDSGGVTGTNPYTLVISAASWKAANFEESDYVNIETGNTDLFEVTSVDPANRTIVVSRVSGSQIPAAADEIFMQGSEDNDPEGLKHVCDATSGSLYSLTVQRRWQAYQKAASGVTITPDLINEGILSMVQKHGKQPNYIATSYTQFRKLLNELEDQKRYNVSQAEVRPKNPKFAALQSWSGINHMGPTGAIPIIPDQFCEDDRMYLLNTDYMEWHRAGGFGWFDDDGTVLLRSSTDDAYEARYGGYMELFIHPLYQGVITGLAT